MSVTKACIFLGITRQAYYKRCLTQMNRQQHEKVIVDFVMDERMRQPRIGTRKLKHLMALQQLFIGRDRLFSLLSSHRLLVSPKRAYHKTTNSHHHFHCHPNLLKAGLVPQAPEQL